MEQIIEDIESKHAETLLEGRPLEQYGEVIRNILTLRYHPFGPTLLPRLEWRHFLEYKGVSHYIQPLLEETIRRIILENKDKKVGMGISGGADSTTVLALTKKCFPDLDVKTYCISFGDDEKEAEDAKYVSELYSTDHKHIQIDNPFKELQTQIEIVREPRWNLYPYFLFREASKECEILLTGDGGDELFGGYVFRYRYVMESSENENLIGRYLEAHNRDWVPDQENLFAKPFNWAEIYDLFTSYFDNPLPVLGKVFLADYNGKLLYDFARTNGAYSEYFNLKTVAPMLEPEVLHMASHIPYSLKYDFKNNIGKIILRQILLENFGYKPAIKGKIGWGMNLVEMWDKYVKDMCEELFDSALFVELGFINNDWIPRGFKKSDEHNIRYINKMLGLLALEIWLRLNESSLLS